MSIRISFNVLKAGLLLLCAKQGMRPWRRSLGKPSARTDSALWNSLDPTLFDPSVMFSLPSSSLLINQSITSASQITVSPPSPLFSQSLPQISPFPIHFISLLFRKVQASLERQPAMGYQVGARPRISSPMFSPVIFSYILGLWAVQSLGIVRGGLPFMVWILY